MLFRKAFLPLATFAASIVPVSGAAHAFVPCEPEGSTKIEYTDTHKDLDKLETFRSVNNSGEPTQFRWTVTQTESREWEVGGEAGISWENLFVKIKGDINGDIVRTYTSSTSHFLSGTVAPHSVATGAYYFGIQHVAGYTQKCQEGGRLGSKQHFKFSAPTGHVFRRDA